jgi:hypothetical protein
MSGSTAGRRGAARDSRRLAGSDVGYHMYAVERAHRCRCAQWPFGPVGSLHVRAPPMHYYKLTQMFE